MTSVNPDFSPLFDTHCHFDFDVFADDFPAQLSAARRHGVTRLLLPAIGPDNWQRLLTLSSEHRELFIALGCHPYFLHRYQLSDLDRLASLLTRRSQQCVAVGECGLDFAIDVDPQLQEKTLEVQFELARRFELPVILHSR